jgi:hypothetical protein
MQLLLVFKSHKGKTILRRKSLIFRRSSFLDTKLTVAPTSHAAILLLTVGNLETYYVRVAFNGITFTYKFTETGHRVQMLKRGTHREQGYLINLHSVFRKGSGLEVHNAVTNLTRSGYVCYYSIQKL